ncbi:hypothetical protein DCMF_26745 [Candidatus Formimonas warabiya]|uniref:Tripartite tricarboxylate transporter substrate binding protein n=1 Tax=Formimonas warabiya TaxID=1761012 RepID=A0A3G1L069_FORW1|nr:hypothetical protein DCMF_26745 [Candidatus Formimonas warabiya]
MKINEEGINLKPRKKLWGTLLGMILAVTITAGCSSPQTQVEYPTKPIKVIVPLAAGGGADILARTVAKYSPLEQPMVVVNLPGGSTVIGTMEAYNSPADGYTLLCANPDAMMAVYLGGTMTTPAWKDMEPLATLVYDGNVVAVSKDSKFHTMQDVIDFAKKNPGKLTWGSAGSKGYLEQVSAEIWEKAGGLQIKYVPFDSTVTARTAAMGGHVDILFGAVSEVVPGARSGDLRPLAVSTAQRSGLLPDTPTLKELGIDIDTGLHRGFMAPPNTPKPVVDILERALKEVYDNPEFLKTIENDLYFEGQFVGAQDLKQLLEDRYPIHERLVKLIGAQK